MVIGEQARTRKRQETSIWTTPHRHVQKAPVSVRLEQQNKLMDIPPRTS